MPVLNNVRSPVYHHFVLLVWEERDSQGRHVTWRFSLRDSSEARIGFKDIDDLKSFLERWLKTSLSVEQQKDGDEINLALQPSINDKQI